ncbi:MAG: dTDP-glucose 4,6-dehydratase [Myxococcales bacterium]
MKIDGKRVLVTGAGGFIGSHLVEALVARGCAVRALARYNGRGDRGMLEVIPPDVREAIEVVLGDVTDPFQVDRVVAGCDVVFHLAALIAIPFSYVAPASYVEANVRGTLNVLEACRRHGVERLVHTSTSETYGTARYTPIDEAHPLQGQSPYSATKIAADKLAESFYRSFEVPVATIRPFNTFGPRQSARAIIPTIISQALANRVVRLGNLAPVRDFTFVRDTAAGFIAVAECDRAIGDVVNVGTGKGIAIGDLAARIVAVLGEDIPVEHDATRLRPDASEVFELLCEATRAREWCGWEPRITLDAGLAEVVAWVEGHLDHYKTGYQV